MSVERYIHDGRSIEPPNKLSNFKLITAILPKGKSLDLQGSLVKDHGIQTATIHHARGVGRFSSMRDKGFGTQLEKEILEVTVSADQADMIFEYMFFQADMNHPHSGIIFMNEAPVATPMHLPDIPPEGIPLSEMRREAD